MRIPNDRPKFSAKLAALAAANAPQFVEEEEEGAAPETFYEYFVNEDNTEWQHWWGVVVSKLTSGCGGGAS